MANTSHQIKADINRSGTEETSMPSFCENCLPDNPYVQMLKQNAGAECKICTRPFTVFLVKADRSIKPKRTNICMTCARLKNCCQSCMLDLNFGLPLTVRDAALKMVAPGPESSINREYYAQNHEREIEEGRGPTEAYEKTDEKARDLLRRLANSEPYYKKQRRLEAEQEEGEPNPLNRSKSATDPAQSEHQTPSEARQPAEEVVEEAEEDDLFPAQPFFHHSQRIFFHPEIRKSHHYPVNRMFTPVTLRIRQLRHKRRSRGGRSALPRQGGDQRMPVASQMGKPKPLDSTDREQRMEWAREGRQTAESVKAAQSGQRAIVAEGSTGEDAVEEEEESGNFVVAPPPGASEVQYASLAGD